MLHLRKRLREWADIVRWHHGSVSWLAMGLAILSGPVPRAIWRARMRKCRQCPVHARRLLRDNHGILKWVGLHLCHHQSGAQTLGCGCNTTFLALTAAPYPTGCWARETTKNDRDGWPAYVFPSRWAKVRAVWRFFVPHRHSWIEIFSATKPSRSDWHCWLRHCRCGRVEYKSFNIFGDGQWHHLHSPKGCQSWEHEGILESARHHGLLK